VVAAKSCAKRGFTLIELLVVLAALGLLLSLAAPRYTEQLDRGRDNVLRHNLAGLRDAINKFYADRARYPHNLHELVAERYLRQLPLDPVTDRSDSWLVVPPTPGQTGVSDVRSGAPGTALDGTLYSTW